MNIPAPDRKALLKARRLKLTVLAARWGVTKGHISRVISGERRSPRLERAIARALRLPLEQAFPEWHGSGRAA